VGAVGSNGVLVPHARPQAPSRREGDWLSPLRGELLRGRGDSGTLPRAAPLIRLTPLGGADEIAPLFPHEGTRRRDG